MKQAFSVFLFIGVFLFSLTTVVNGQSFVISPEDPYEVYVEGSSSLHGWKATVGKVADYPQSLKGNLKNGGAIENFGFKAEVKSMEGGRGSAMDNKIYKALQSEEHPFIIYTQSGPAAIEAMPDGQYKLTSTGTLNIAGVEKKISIEVNASMAGGKLTFQGSKPLKLSDFDIEPPSAMFGQIVTKDDITVHFTFNYQAQ